MLYGRTTTLLTQVYEIFGQLRYHILLGRRVTSEYNIIYTTYISACLRWTEKKKHDKSIKGTGFFYVNEKKKEKKKLT